MWCLNSVAAIFPRQFQTNDQHLCYMIFAPIYSDKLFANTVSRGVNKCIQMSVTNFGSSHSIPMKLKSKTHRVLLLLYQWDWVQPAMKCDNTKGMIQGNFNRKLEEVLCHFSQTKPISPCLNVAEKEIK